MYISVEVDPEQLALELSAKGHADAMKLILDIDLAVADAGFTEDLIKALWKSLCVDLDSKEQAEFLKALKKE
jgi:hypothetical protein